MFKNKKLMKVGMAFMALIVTMAMSVTATYAWFAISASPRVESFNLEVLSGGETLQISFVQTDDWASANQSANFKTNLTATDWTKLMTDLGTSGFRMGASTTTDGSLITGESDSGVARNISAVADNSGQGGYLEFHIRFRGTDDLNVSLDSSVTNTGLTAAAFSTDPLASNYLRPIYAWDVDPGGYDGIEANTFGTHVAIPTGTPIYTSAAAAARFSFTDDISDTAQRAYLEARAVYEAAKIVYDAEILALRGPEFGGVADTFVKWLDADDKQDGGSDKYTKEDDLYNPTALNDFETLVKALGSSGGNLGSEPAVSVTKLTQTTAEVAALKATMFTKADAVTLSKIWNPMQSGIPGMVNLTARGVTNHYVFNNLVNPTDSSPTRVAERFSNAARNQFLGTSTTLPGAVISDIDTLFFNGGTGEIVQLVDETATAAAGATNVQSNYYYGSITLKIWIEGWDANCFNQMLTDKFDTKLGFIGMPS